MLHPVNAENARIRFQGRDSWEYCGEKRAGKVHFSRWTLELFNQERLKQLEAKQKEKERNEKYSKLKTKAKDDRAKMRDKVRGYGRV